MKTKFSSFSKIALNLKYKSPKIFANSLGDRPTYTNWNKDQPDNFNDPEEYVTMTVKNGKWDDFPGLGCLWLQRFNL